MGAPCIIRVPVHGVNHRRLVLERFRTSLTPTKSSVAPAGREWARRQTLTFSEQIRVKKFVNSKDQHVNRRIIPS